MLRHTSATPTSDALLDLEAAPEHDPGHVLSSLLHPFAWCAVVAGPEGAEGVEVESGMALPNEDGFGKIKGRICQATSADPPPPLPRHFR